MSITIDNRIALGNISDLTIPTATQNLSYRLGDVIGYIDSDTKTIKKYMYVKSHTGLTAYQPYAIAYGATAGSEVITAAPVALTDANVYICWPQVAFTSGYYGFVQIEGNLTSAITASTGAIAGNALTIAAAGTTLVTTTGATRTAKTVGYLVATTTGATCSVYAPGMSIHLST